MDTSELKKFESALSEIKSQIEGKSFDQQKCEQLIALLKMSVANILGRYYTGFDFYNLSPADISQLCMAREALECATLVAVKCEDILLFENNVKQLSTFYYDCNKVLPASDKQLAITGMYLLHLLGENRMGEFHMEVEKLPSEARTHIYIKHPVELEKYITDGNYNKVVNSASEVPLPTYKFFMSQLAQTIRSEVASCLEAAYTRVALTHAATLLMLTQNDIHAYVELRNDNLKQEKGDMDNGTEKGTTAYIKWVISGDQLVFERVNTDKSEIPSHEIIHNAISYATEIERIV